MVEAYCVKCKKKGTVMKNPEVVKTAKGGFMAKGACPTCGTSMCAMLSAENAEKAIKAGAKKAY